MSGRRLQALATRMGWPGVAVLVLGFSYLGFLAAGLPAATLWRSLEPRMNLPTTMEIHGISGTVWSGQVADLRWDNQHLGSLTWRWQGSALLRGSIGLQLTWTLDAAELTGQLHLRPFRVEGHHVQGQWPATQLQQWLDLPLLFGGEVHIALARVDWHQDLGLTAATGSLLWADAAMGLPQPAPLGTLRADLSVADPGQLRLDLESAPEAPVQISGHVIVLPPLDYRTDLNLLPTASANATLRTALSQLGTAQPDGSRRLLQTSPGFPY